MRAPPEGFAELLRGPGGSDLIERAARAMGLELLAGLDGKLVGTLAEGLGKIERAHVAEVVERARNETIEITWPRHIRLVCAVLEATLGYVVSASDREGIRMAVERARHVLSVGDAATTSEH